MPKRPWKPGTRALNIRDFDMKLHTAAKRRAATQHRTLHALVEQAVREYLERVGEPINGEQG